MDLVVFLAFGLVGAIACVLLFLTLRAKGEAGKLTAENVRLSEGLEQAERRVSALDADSERLSQLAVEKARLEQELSGEKDLLEMSDKAKNEAHARVDSLHKDVAVLTEKNAGLDSDLKNRSESLDSAERRVVELESEVGKHREEASSLSSEVTKLRGRVDDLRDRLEEREKLEQRFSDSFRSLSAKTLEQQSKNFMESADASLRERQEAVEKLVKPLSQKIETLEKSNADGAGVLRQQIETLAKSSKDVASEARTLSNALSRPQVRGRWGEMQVERALDLSGLTKGIHYTTQDSDNQGGRTDFIVHLPHNRDIVLDSKVPLTAYMEADAADNDSVREKMLQGHARQVKSHADSLARKEYWNKLPDAVDFVVMVVPEFALPPAVAKDQQLIEDALAKNVVITTYSTLVALLKSVAMSWRERKMTEEAMRIGKLGIDLYERLAVFADHVQGVGKALDTAVSRYNESVGSFESRVLVQARRFKDLGISSSKELGDAGPVDRSVRFIGSNALEESQRVARALEESSDESGAGQVAMIAGVSSKRDDGTGG